MRQVIHLVLLAMVVLQAVAHRVPVLLVAALQLAAHLVLVLPKVAVHLVPDLPVVAHQAAVLPVMENRRMATTEMIQRNQNFPIWHAMR